MSAINLLVVSVIGIVFLSVQVEGKAISTQDEEALSVLHNIISAYNKEKGHKSRTIVSVDSIDESYFTSAPIPTYTFGYNAKISGSSSNWKCQTVVKVQMGKKAVMMSDTCS